MKETGTKTQYKYAGSVKLYGTVLETNWVGCTRAVSPKQAKSNLAYQFKKLRGFTPGARITLPDAVIAAD